MSRLPLGFLEILALALVAVALWVPLVRICQRAGLSPWLALLTFVPGVNLVLLYVIAFSRWPKVDRAR